MDLQSLKFVLFKMFSLQKVICLKISNNNIYVLELKSRHLIDNFTCRNWYQNNQNVSTTINWKYARSKKRFLYLLLLPHISSASVIAFSKKKTDDLYSYVCFLPEKNSLLRIGKHKRCSLSIYHTSFDPHQLHYSKATIEEERNIPRPYH